MKQHDHNGTKDAIDLTYRGLYKAGALSALAAALIFRRNLDAEWLLLRVTGVVTSGPTEPPTSIQDWYSFLQHQKLLGLTLLNLFDLVNYALVGLIFLALYMVLRRSSPSWTILAAVLSFTGISIYFASNQAFSLLSLSEQYKVATTGTERELLLAAGQATLAIHNNASYAGGGIYLSFLLISAAGLIFSVVLLSNNLFRKGTAFLGIFANGIGLGYYLVLSLAPTLVFIPLSISAVFLLAWYLQISVQLWRLSSDWNQHP